QVITRGMPGSAMFPFGHLPEGDRKALVVYVRHLLREGAIEQARQQAAAMGEELTRQEVEKDIDQVIKPGKPLAMPEKLPTSSPQAIARGRELYAKSCISCHGDKGKGEGTQEQKNSDGRPTRPRDFTRGIFKGGREFPQLYARIMQGMPGSPMPASSSAYKPEEVADMIHYILSLSDPRAQGKVDHKRTTLVAHRVDGAV